MTQPLPLNWNSEFIALLASMLRPEVYVELGVHTAGTFNLVAPFAGRAVGVDIDPTAERHMTHAANTHFHCGTTRSFADQLGESGTMIDMLFIDADHSREAVLQDFRDYFPHVRPQGLILLHDSHPGDESMFVPHEAGNGYLAVEELSRDTVDYEMVTIALSPGLTICRKRTRQLAWQEPTSNGVAPPSNWRGPDSHGDGLVAPRGSLAWKVALYERTMGLAVLPVLLRRAALVLHRFLRGHK